MARMFIVVFDCASFDCGKKSGAIVAADMSGVKVERGCGRAERQGSVEACRAPIDTIDARRSTLGPYV